MAFIKSGGELQLLRTVVAAADYGSFRRAAMSLSLRQSSLSRRVRSLEEQLGVLLFKRSTGGVQLTPAGAGLVRSARQILEQVDHLLSLAQSTGRGETGHIAFGFCTSTTITKLRSVLREYSRTFPRVDVHMVEWSRTRLLEGLRSGDLDIVVVAGEPKDHSGTCIALWSERVLIALPVRHSLTRSDFIYWTDLGAESFLVSQRDLGPDLRNILVAKLSAPGSQLDIATWDIDTKSILAIIEDGCRLTVHCESSACPEHPNISYKEVRDAVGPTYITFRACWNQHNANPAVVKFVELLCRNSSLLGLASVGT